MVERGREVVVGIGMVLFLCEGIERRLEVGGRGSFREGFDCLIREI